MEQNMEQIIMEMVVNGGDARSKALEAIQAARHKDFAQAAQLMNECETALAKAHQVQTEMIVKELNGEGQSVQLLMVHAQDHMMNAMTVRDLAEQIIEILKEMKS